VCPACGAIFYQNPKIVAASLPLQRGGVFLLRRAIEPGFGLWTYPAGYMELDETVEEAARRETREEIRARLGPLGPPMIYSYPDASVVTIVYAARIVGGRPRPGPEALEVRLFSPAEIPWEGLAFRSTYHALKDWVASDLKGR
jgi:ADP-ribose pyrophosphatase YjhB (NUDIX family)